MIETIRKVGQELSRSWDHLAEGWRELRQRSGDAITKFFPQKTEPDGEVPRGHPTWAVLAGEIADTGKDLVVRLEMPGINRDDCEVVLTRDSLRVVGEKRSDREMLGANFYVNERAYGRFQRNIALPVPVDSDRAHANFRNGVLTVKAPKLSNRSQFRLKVQ